MFRGLSVAAAFTILATLAGVAIFLTAEGLPGILASPSETKAGESFASYVLPLVFGTVWAAALALLIAAPLAIGVALFISHYAPKKLAQPIGFIIDLLAAIPSVVYGFWGMIVLATALQPSFDVLNEWFGWLPFFSGPVSSTGRSMLTATLVLAVMILPIMTALCREIFLQTPRLHQEAALALGATRWEMIRLSVLPYARSGIVSSAMLALGRALGETMAIALVLSATPGVMNFDLIGSNNPQTIAANIALNFPESSGIDINVLIATGLVLFVITFVVNYAARWIVDRQKEFSGAN